MFLTWQCLVDTQWICPVDTLWTSDLSDDYLAIISGEYSTASTAFPLLRQMHLDSKELTRHKRVDRMAWLERKFRYESFVTKRMEKRRLRYVAKGENEKTLYTHFLSLWFYAIICGFLLKSFYLPPPSNLDLHCRFCSSHHLFLFFSYIIFEHFNTPRCIRQRLRNTKFVWPHCGLPKIFTVWIPLQSCDSPVAAQW